MSKNIFANDATVTLKGGLTVERAGELHRVLADRLDALAQPGPVPQCISIDLSGASDIDACGCQMLSLFVEHVRRLGSVATIPESVPAELRGRISLLGFGALLAPKPGDQCPQPQLQPAKEIA